MIHLVRSRRRRDGRHLDARCSAGDALAGVSVEFACTSQAALTLTVAAQSNGVAGCPNIATSATNANAAIHAIRFKTDAAVRRRMRYSTRCEEEIATVGMSARRKSVIVQIRKHLAPKLPIVNCLFSRHNRL